MYYLIKSPIEWISKPPSKQRGERNAAQFPNSLPAMEPDAGGKKLASIIRRRRRRYQFQFSRWPRRLMGWRLRFSESRVLTIVEPFALKVIVDFSETSPMNYDTGFKIERLDSQ